MHSAVGFIYGHTDLAKIDHPYATRRKVLELYVYDRYNKTVCQKNIKYNGTRLFNALPINIKQLPSYKFKRESRKYIANNYNALVLLLA